MPANFLKVDALTGPAVLLFPHPKSCTKCHTLSPANCHFAICHTSAEIFFESFAAFLPPFSPPPGLICCCLSHSRYHSCPRRTRSVLADYCRRLLRVSGACLGLHPDCSANAIHSYRSSTNWVPTSLLLALRHRNTPGVDLSTSALRPLPTKPSQSCICICVCAWSTGPRSHHSPSSPTSRLQTPTRLHPSEPSNHACPIRHSASLPRPSTTFSPHLATSRDLASSSWPCTGLSLSFA